MLDILGGALARMLAFFAVVAIVLFLFAALS
jgi:hypothetical protein